MRMLKTQSPLIRHAAMIGIVGALAVSLATPSSAATRSRGKMIAPPEQSQGYEAFGPLGGLFGNERGFAAPSGSGECVTDEGYGRTATCDTGGGS